MKIIPSELPKGSKLRKRIEKALADERDAEKANRTQNPVSDPQISSKPSYRAVDLLIPISEMKLRKTFHVEPVKAPRQNHSDRWRKRPSVIRYREFRDEINRQLGDYSMPYVNWWVIFYLPMPKSWSNKKKAKMLGTFHQQTPDKDNLEKSFLDSIFRDLKIDDKVIADGRVTKVWTHTGKGRIEVYH